MTASPLTVVAAASVVASATAGGMMFVFSALVMQGLDRTGGVQAITAMRGINAEAESSAVFLSAYLGAALLALAVGVLALLQWRAPGSTWLLAGAVLGVVGVIVTAVANVPLNNGLDATHATDASVAVWQAYATAWTAWNHVRTATSLAASVVTVIGLTQR